MKKLGIVLALALVLSGKQTYYGNNTRGSCESCAGMNPEVDFSTNLLSNGDFEFETIPNDKSFVVFRNIPSWTSKGNYEIQKCSNIETSMPSQCLELGSAKGGTSYSQSVNLTEAKYEIKFDAAPIRSQSP